jgi:hypothetical protein
MDSAVAQWREGASASVLLRSHRDLLEVAAGGGPLRAGVEVKAGRSKLKLLAAQGWLAGCPAACSRCRITQRKQ